MPMLARIVDLMTVERHRRFERRRNVSATTMRFVGAA